MHHNLYQFNKNFRLIKNREPNKTITLMSRINKQQSTQTQQLCLAVYIKI